MSLIILLAQCVCMFIASFAVGSLPLMFKSTTSGKLIYTSKGLADQLGTRLKAVSTLGMGLLVGAALTIIIPE
jgi:zinc transporter 9